jgi:ubiquinone/menaquinone biosynthesis C-methylase UbiE
LKDNFSIQADVYAKYRPGYPAELFDFIIGKTLKRDVAWDCATGNGQTAKELAPHFSKVMATDISRKQIDHAYQSPSIIYSVQPAEQTDFADQSFDLVTVSQALHWFNFEKFYAEVNRVGKPGAYLAAWMYSLLRISNDIDKIIDEYHFHTMEKYWDKERKYVDENYASVPFPFEEISSPVFSIEYYWNLDELEGYFNTWSALQKFIAANQYNPVPELIASIRPYWKSDKMKIVFPLHLRMGRVE